jgi:putative sigma-54 modulation protein
LNAGLKPTSDQEAHMNIDVHSVHFELSEASRNYLDTKVERIGYAKDMIIDLLFVFTKDSKRYKLEVTANFRWGARAHIEETVFDFNSGIDILIDKLDQKLTKEKEKVQEKK